MPAAEIMESAPPPEPGRVLLVGPVAASDGGEKTGGIATHVSELARALAREGWEVAVYADDATPAEGPRRAVWGTIYVRPPAGKNVRSFAQALTPRRLGTTLRVLRDPVARALGQRAGVTVTQVAGIAAAANAHRPDVIHHHSADFRPLYARLAGLGGIPSVITAHSLSRFYGKQPAAMADAVLGNLRAADGVICVSDDVCSELGQLAPDVATVQVPNGVDLSRFSPPRDHPAGPPVVLYAGRVVPDKGCDDLIAAVARMRERVPDAMLVLAGPVEGFDPLEVADTAGLPRNALVVTGAVDESDVARLMRGASFFAMPSRLREGQPRAIIEAMATGLPVVATTVGSIPDMLDRGAGGLLVPPGDPDALADALVRLATGPAEAARLTAWSLRASRAFDIDQVAEQVADMYQHVMMAR